MQNTKLFKNSLEIHSLTKITLERLINVFTSEIFQTKVTMQREWLPTTVLRELLWCAAKQYILSGTVIHKFLLHELSVSRERVSLSVVCRVNVCHFRWVAA